jgi:AcrR family transcriptional regulator
VQEPGLDRPTNATGRETRQLLIRTAERLFAEQGIDAVSLRQISAAAGRRMAGAVRYHFGDKTGLIRAIIEDRTAREDELRRPLLEELARKGRTGDLRALAEAGIRPAVEQMGETGYYFRFLAQLDRHPHQLSELRATGAFRSTLQQLLELQDRAAGELPPPILERRRRLATHLAITALADLEADGGRGADQTVADLIDCIVALYSTPPSPETLETLPARRQRLARRST